MDRGHVLYCDNKLIRILQLALGGNAKFEKLLPNEDTAHEDARKLKNGLV